MLDYQSRTSVNLVKILVNNFWKLNVSFYPTHEGFKPETAEKGQAVLVIGDRIFSLENIFEYKYDLAEEWISYIGLPFVFAAWISNKPLSQAFKNDLNHALKVGIENIDKAVESMNNPVLSKHEAKDYLHNNLSFNLDEEKIKGMKLFLSMINEFE
jgi:chorismate dehydratase